MGSQDNSVLDNSALEKSILDHESPDNFILDKPDRSISLDLSLVNLTVAVSLSLVLLATGCRWWLGHPLLIFSDQGLFVSMAQILLDGGIPYVDMFDVNPPLAIYIQILPVLMARFLYIPVTLSFSIYVWALAFLSCLLSSAILFSARRTGAMLLGACALIGFAYFNQIQRLDFGQREHIFCIVYLPFLILRYLRWHGFTLPRWQAIAAGVFAGIGLALKPHFILMACAPEIVWWLRERRFKPFVAAEVLAAIAVIAVYLVHFVFLPAQELAAFKNFVVPIYQEGYEYYVTSPIFNMATFWRNDFILLALASALALAFAESSSLALALCGFSFMSALVYALAGQAWSCHMVAVRMGNAMAFCVEAGLLYQLLPSKFVGYGSIRLSRLTGASMACAILGGGAYLQTVAAAEAEEKLNQQPYSLSVVGYPRLGMGPADDMDPFAASCLSNSNRGDYVLFICSSMAPGYPVLLQTERKPASRFLHGMMLPILTYIIDKPELSTSAKERFVKDKQQVIDWYAEDIAKNKPKLIYIQDNPMNWVFEHDNFIATKMANYKLLETKDGISIYKRHD